MAEEPSWLKKRAEAFLDNLIFYGALALGGAAIGLAAAFGTDDATLPLWLVVLFGAVQVLTILALILLWRRPRAVLVEQPEGAPPQRHPHAALLARIRALDRSLAEVDPLLRIRWPSAETFNSILREAKEKTEDPALDHINPFYESTTVDDDFADSGDIALARTLLAQVEAVVENSE